MNVMHYTAVSFCACRDQREVIREVATGKYFWVVSPTMLMRMPYATSSTNMER